MLKKEEWSIRMLLPREFFRLQLRFAEKLAHICHSL